MSADNKEKLICGFPQNFSSNTDVLELILNRLLENIKVQFALNEYDMTCHIRCTTTVNGEQIKLPTRWISDKNTEQCITLDIQKILDLNGRQDLVVCMDHNQHRRIEICTKAEFLGKLDYPIKEYRVEIGADGISLCHPNICHTWLWISPHVVELFPEGSPDDFPRDSPYGLAAYGPITCSSQENTMV